jgi:hypothetical protein
LEFFEDIPSSTTFDPDNLLFGDFQQYTIDENTEINTNYGGTIPANMPWDGAEVRNGVADCPYPPTGGDPTTSNRGIGWIFTKTSIPDGDWAGDTAGTIPGYYNNTCLKIENYCYTLGDQGEMVLNFGTAASDPENIPGDVWFQFWIFFPDDSAQLSLHNNMKFIYPGKAGVQTSSYQNELLDWLTHFGVGGKCTPILHQGGSCRSWSQTDTADRYFRPFSEDAGTPTHLSYPWTENNSPYYGDICTGLGYTDNDHELGHVDPDTGMSPGKWYLVRLHYNTSQAAYNDGQRHLAEGYIWEQGVADFSLMYRWQNGQDYLPDMSAAGYGRGGIFTWQLQGSKVGGASEGQWGHKAIWWPSNQAPGTPTATSGDHNWYISDFVAIAGTDCGGLGVDGLPQYTANGGPA